MPRTIFNKWNCCRYWNHVNQYSSFNGFPQFIEKFLQLCILYRNSNVLVEHIICCYNYILCLQLCLQLISKYFWINQFQYDSRYIIVVYFYIEILYILEHIKDQLHWFSMIIDRIPIFTLHVFTYIIKVSPALIMQCHK